MNPFFANAYIFNRNSFLTLKARFRNPLDSSKLAVRFLNEGSSTKLKHDFSRQLKHDSSTKLDSSMKLKRDFNFANLTLEQWRSSKEQHSL